MLSFSICTMCLDSLLYISMVEVSCSAALTFAIVQHEIHIPFALVPKYKCCRGNNPSLIKEFLDPSQWSRTPHLDSQRMAGPIELEED